MPESNPAGRYRAAGMLLAGCALSLLTGCADGPAGIGAWGFAGLALIGAAAAAHALGRSRSRAALRQARAEVREMRQLHGTWLWHTDARHTLVAWTGPGRAAESRCGLFEGAAGTPTGTLAGSGPSPFAPLTERLRAGQAFADLRLEAPEPVSGARTWILAGLPRHDDEGRFCGFVGSARPTDELETLRASAAALPALLGALPGPTVWAAATPTGWQVRHFNPAAATYWPALARGAPLELLAGRLPAAVADALPARDAPAAQALEVEGWQIQPCPAPAGEVAGEVATGAAALLLMQRPASGRENAAARADSDNFSFTVSHDLRAPIRVVEGFTRIVKEDYGRLLDRVGNDHLDRVLGAAARMNLMIDALLTLARLSSQPLAHQPVNLSQLAGFVVDDLRRSAPDREVEVEIEPGLSAQGDPTLLRLVLENLLGNAWKYSARCAPARITLRAVPHAGGRALVVRDNGAGFDMRSADRLFGLFQRLHSASEFPGHGVGLASVRRIVARHGGEIWAEAEPGRGAAFFFTLGP